MTNAEMRRQVKQRIDRLSPERLRVADDFLACLEERESDEATDELLRVAGFLEMFEQARQDIAAGNLTPVEQLRRGH